MRLIAGLIQPKAGTVSYKGRPQAKPGPDIAIVFQDYTNALLPWRDAEGNVALALEAIGIPRSERKDRIHQLLNMVGLGEHAKSFPAQLSGGMQQRLQITRCLAQQPSVLLMDEPPAAFRLHPQSRSRTSNPPKWFFTDPRLLRRCRDGRFQ